MNLPQSFFYSSKAINILSESLVLTWNKEEKILIVNLNFSNNNIK